MMETQTGIALEQGDRNSTVLINDVNRGSVVSLVTDGPDDRGSYPIRGNKLFLFSNTFRPALGPTQPPIQ